LIKTSQELSVREKFIILVDNDYLKKSEIIVLLQGDGINRVEKAAKLFLAGFAPKVMVSGGVNNVKSGAFQNKIIINSLISYGLRRQDILIEERSRNTREQAENVLELARVFNWKKMILVASHYHQYRAYLTFLKRMKELNILIEIINAPVKNLKWFEENKWGKRFDILAEEFDKIERYRKLGHIATYEEAIEYQKWKELRT